MSRSKKPAIKNEDSFRQAVLFEGLNMGKISLSDIDAILEIRDRYLVLFEVKKRGVDIPRGQRSMLETIADVWKESGRLSIVVKAVHSVPSSKDIYLKNCEVEEVYYNGSWKTLGEIKVQEFLNNFYKKNKIEL